MPVNVKLADSNFSEGPTAGNFYSCSFSRQSLVQVDAIGAEVNSFFVTRSSFRTPVLQLHYDGTFFWTLEELPSDLGVVIKKWRILPVPTAAFPNLTPIEFRWQDELTLINQTRTRWFGNAFAVEHYHKTISEFVVRGSSSIKLNNVDNISPGNTLYLQSTVSGTQEQVVVGGINPTTGEISFGKVGGLKADHGISDPVSLTKGLFLFNDHSHGSTGTEDGQGALIKFSYPDKTAVFSDGSAQYNQVSAADFDETSLLWVKGFQILEIDFSNPTFSLKTSQEANLLESDKNTIITVFDLISDLSGNQHRKLQDRETTQGDFDSLVTEIFSMGPYNFQNHATLPFVNSLALEFDTRFTEDQGSGDTIAISAMVRDQSNFPIFNKTVNFTSTINVGPGDPGTFDPTGGTTNTSGIVQTVYTPSTTSTSIIVNIIADVLEGANTTEQISTTVHQIGSIAASSAPIEQSDTAPATSSQPIEQRAALSTDDLFSQPIEQAPVPSFSNESLEQRDLSRNVPTAEPIEQQIFTGDATLIEQRMISMNAQPMEQVISGTFSSVQVEQFNFSDLIFPPCGSTKNPVTTNILWRILDRGFPFDVGSLIFKVNGIAVQDDVEFTVTAIANGLQLDYNPPAPFAFDSTVNIQLTITDTDPGIPTIVVYNCSWDTVPDTQPPVIDLISPKCDAMGVGAATPVVFSVLDVGDGVDLSSITLSIEGLPVCSGLSFDPITLTSGTGFTGTWSHPDDLFRFDSTVSVAIEATDLSPLANSTFFVCCFSTAESSVPVYQNFSPEQCSTFVDNITGLTFEVYGDMDGIDISTLEVRIDNKLRKVIVRPRVVRSE